MSSLISSVSYDIIFLMKNFQPGGLRGRKPDLGGRPQSDVNSYAPKFRSAHDRGEAKPRFNDRNNSSDRGNREVKRDVQLFDATCTTCGKSCEVPFRPDGTKPVLCRDCFAAKNAAPTNMASGRDRFTPNELVGHKPARTYDAPRDTSMTYKQSAAQHELLLKQLAVVETKVSQILELISISEKLITALPIVATDGIAATESSELKKVRKPKKEVVKKAVKKVAKKTPAKAKKASKKKSK